MNTLLTRLNGVFSFTLTALAVVTVLCFLSTAFKERTVATATVTVSPTYEIGIKEVLNQQTKIKNDLVDLKLKINANFSDLFDWNVKQLFVYVVATYKTRRHSVNEVVIWDKIILRSDTSVHIDLFSSDVEYPLLDHGLGLIGNENVTLQLCWNVIPLAGQLPLVKSGYSRIPIPSHYA